MKYGKLTLGQIEAVINMAGGYDKVKDLLTGKCKMNLEYSTVQQKKDAERYLGKGHEFCLTDLNYDLDHFLYKWKQMKSKICYYTDFLDAALYELEVGDKKVYISLPKQHLKMVMVNREIESDTKLFDILPKNAVFEDPLKFLVILNTLIHNQIDGQKGILTTHNDDLGDDSYDMNHVFFVRAQNNYVVVVELSKPNESDQWNVSAKMLGCSGLCYAESKVFMPMTKEEMPV